jgi:hypothetical protein
MAWTNLILTGPDGRGSPSGPEGGLYDNNATHSSYALRLRASASAFCSRGIQRKAICRKRPARSRSMSASSAGRGPMSPVRQDRLDTCIDICRCTGNSVL